MHILFITDNFPPESNAPATRTYEHAKAWVKLGAKVTVITCVPNFPEGKVYESYQNKLYQKEVVDGIEVRRVKTYIAPNSGVLKRTLDFISFMLTSFIAGFFVKKTDVVVGTSPQFFTAISSWGISLFKRVPFVFELRDIWPASIKAVGIIKKGPVLKILEFLELFLYRRAKTIIVVTNSFKGELIARGIEESKIKVVANGVNVEIFQNTQVPQEYFTNKYDLNDKFVVGYIGTHGMAHALHHLIDAAKALENQTSIVFLFVGSGADKQALVEYSKRLKLKNVLFLPRQRRSAVSTLLSLCNVSFVSLKNEELFKTVMPSKIFESIAANVPILLAAPKGEAYNLISESKCGITVRPESADEIVKGITMLKRNSELRKTIANNCFVTADRYSRENRALEMYSYLEGSL